MKQQKPDGKATQAPPQADRAVNVTIERYVEDGSSETGLRRMTMEEELSGLDKAFQNAADKAEVDAKTSRILDGYKEKLSKMKSGQKLSADADKAKDVRKNVSRKLLMLAQYKVYGSKEGGMVDYTV